MSVERSERPEGPKASFTSYGAFDECRRKWLYTYACDHLPGAPLWPIIQQKKLAPWETFAGKVVDRTLSIGLLHYKQYGVWPQDLRKIALSTASEGWEYSKQWVRAVANRGKWPPPPCGFQPLDRHYYREEFDATETRNVKEKVVTSVENFLESDVRRFIEGFDTKYWRGPRPDGEPFPLYMLNEVPVWAVYDFAIQTPDEVYLIDWKTGKLTGETYHHAIEQLHWYALYAVTEWGAAIESIRLMPVWLQPEVVVEQVPVRQVDLDALARKITQRHTLLLDLLHMDEGGRVVLEEWPITSLRWRCRRCEFRGACEGARRLREDEAA